MPLIAEYAKRFGVYDDLPPYLSFALGAGETTVLRMATAYSMFANGGKRIKPTLIDRIQDRYGHTIYKHDQRECRGCDADKWDNQPEPSLVDKREQVIDPMTAYQITSMMEGVVQRGTGTVAARSRQAGRRQDRHHQRRKGRLVRRLLARSRGRRLSRLRQAARISAAAQTGGHLAAPIVRDFMKVALADKPAVPFRVPAGIKLIRIDAKTGMRAGPGGGGDPRSLQARHRAARQLFGHGYGDNHDGQPARMPAQQP